jgi:hypothetical protein
MSYHQHRRHDSSQEIEGISLSDFRSSSTSYKAVTGFEEADLADEHSSLRPIIPRKPLANPSPTFAPLNQVNHDFTIDAARLLPQKRLWRTLICVLLGTLSVPFYVFCGFAWHYHNEPVESAHQWGMLSSFGNKVCNTSGTMT